MVEQRMNGALEHDEPNGRYCIRIFPEFIIRRFR
jgi:hypothetical protein